MTNKKYNPRQKKTNGGVSEEAVIAWIILLLIVASILAAMIGQSMQNSYDALQATAQTSAAPQSQASSTPASQASTAPESPETAEELQREIDFASLLAENEDTIAWLEVPGTSVDYPAVYNSDTQSAEHYYLNRGFDKQPSKSGTIYLAPENNPSFTERHIVIYGHNMQDGSMFASLHEFEDKTFFDNNRFVYLYTPDALLTFEIVAAYETDDRNLHYEADFTDDKYYEEFLQSIARGKSGGNGTGTTLSTNDTILTLSTCVENEKQRRYLVQAVLVNE
ncbi:class B sortase [Christensenellaceae bacterium OttesenSCG-928-K19]|nr:class B sortase [Christensenellaceae bacterium OttesenSCG-928-K19]